MRQPPRLAQWLFDWYCNNAKVDDLRGDMEEIYLRNFEKNGRRKANWIYWRQVLALIFSYAIKKRKQNASYHHLSSPLNQFEMFGNYLKVGFRNLVRYRYFTLINMLGLAIGMSISLLIITLFSTVCDFDQFHEKKFNIYRINSTVTESKTEYASSPIALGERLKADYPGIEAVVNLQSNLYSGEPLPKKQAGLRGYYADKEFLSTFTFPLVAGDINSALADPHAVVITQELAKVIFNDQDPMGRDVTIDKQLFQVRGILKDFPTNTHFSFNALASYEGIRSRVEKIAVDKQWSTFRNHYVYVQLKEGHDPALLQQYLDKLSSRVYKNKSEFEATFYLQALGDITPGPEFENEHGPSWSYLSFVIAGGLALLILLPACFNYTNISIARALKRSKEIGLRKTLGGLSHQIFAQFIAETVIVTSFALIGAFVIFIMIRHEFQATLVNATALDLSLTADRLFFFILFAVFTGFVAGVLPAIHFSRLNPIEAIKNNLATRSFSGIKLRKALIVFQFALCLTFILGLVIFNKQYRYAMNFDLGFDQENILDVELQDVNPDIVRNEFSKLPYVQKISMSSGVVGHGVPQTKASLAGSKDSLDVFQMYVDRNFIDNVGITLIAGKTFDEKETSETSVIINQKMLASLSFAGPSEALGQLVNVDSLSLKIIGVVDDFHFWQLHAPPTNFFFRQHVDNYRLANIKIATTDIQASLFEMEQTWKRISNGGTFTAHFLSDETSRAFDQYRVLLKMFAFMGLLAVSISCLGLLGMVVYTAESKTKEVGIRKVMGASRWNLAVLLSKDFLKLMFIASLFALPLALLFDKVLSGMAYYRVAITVLDIFGGLAIMFALGIGTMASQTWRTASVNPADTLKYE